MTDHTITEDGSDRFNSQAITESQDIEQINNGLGTDGEGNAAAAYLIGTLRTESIFPSPMLPFSHNGKTSEQTSYIGTGFSDDGRSLTPEPNSSEAETEHLSSTNEEEDEEDDEIEGDSAHKSESMRSIRNLQADDMSESEQESDTQLLEEISDSGDRTATGSIEIDPVDDNDDKESTTSRPDHPSQTHLFYESNDESAMDTYEDRVPMSEPKTRTPSPPPAVDTPRDGSPLRKRKRADEPGSPNNSKRLAPLKLSITNMSEDELDNDGDEDNDDDPDDDDENDGLDAGTEALSDTEHLRTDPATTDDFVAKRVPLAQSLPFSDLNTTSVTDVLEENREVNEPELKQESVQVVTPGIELDAEPETLDEDEEEEIEAEEEIQDDTEREERNKNRQAAMEALRQIEIDFARLRSKLFEERMIQIESEIALAESGEHPLLVEKAAQNQGRHSGRIHRAEILLRSRKTGADLEFRARKFMAHSQFAQDKQKLRANLLSRTSAEWFQIHREKRVIDMAVPEYGYCVSDRKSTQVKHRREFEAEVSILASIKKSIGFPAAPAISVALSKDIDADLAEMGLLKQVGTNHRDSGRAMQHANHQHVVPHFHTSMAAHLNHHTHANHPHPAHPISHSKSHHHRKLARKAKSQGELTDVDLHTPAHHIHPRNASPQVTQNLSFHSHNYPAADSQSRKVSSQTAAPPPTDHDRKPTLQASSMEGKNREVDRPPQVGHVSHFSNVHAFHQPVPTSSTGSAQFGQKQAQNLPNILRQEISDKNRANLLPLTSATQYNTAHDYSATNGAIKGHGSQYWPAKLPDPARSPAPAISSNSAFNATLSQPGSASYIPPKTYSPAAQTSNTGYKASGMANHHPQSSNVSSQQYQHQQLPPFSPRSATEGLHPTLPAIYQPKAQVVDNRPLFGAKTDPHQP